MPYLGALSRNQRMLQRAAFEAEMRCANADWQMQLYGHTVHSFTNHEVAKRNMPEAIRYNPDTNALAWALMLDLFSQVLT